MRKEHMLWTAGIALAVVWGFTTWQKRSGRA